MVDAYLAALNMLPAERRVRMRHLRSTVIRHDVYRWAECALGTIAADDDAVLQDARADNRAHADVARTLTSW